MLTSCSTVPLISQHPPASEATKSAMAMLSAWVASMRPATRSWFTFVLGLIDLEFGRSFEIALRVGLVDGRGLHAKDLARQALRRRGDFHEDGGHDDCRRVVVVVAEIDRLLALFGDRHGGHDHVDLLAGQ